MAASRYSIRSARMLRAPIKAPIRADARQIRLQSSLPSQNSVPAAGSGGNGFAGGIAGGALVFALGYGYYHYSGAKSIVDGAAATKKQFQNVRASMKDKAPQPNELLKWFRNVATSYVAFIPGAKPYVDSVFNDIDAVEIKHRGKVDEILRDAYSEMMEETKGELTMETAQKTWEILQKYLKKLTELAGNASSEILDNHPHLKEKVGGNIEQLKQMAESYGPEAKKELNKTYDEIKDIVSTSSGTNVADKIRKAVEESMERLKKIGDEAWKKGIEKAQPYLNKNPEIKKIVEENADSLKRQNFDELFEKIKNGDASDIKDYVRKAGEKSKNSGMGKSIHEYITMIPGGQEILPNLEKLQGAVKKHGGEAEKIAKDAYKEISEILSKKADEVEKLAEEAKEEARK